MVFSSIPVYLDPPNYLQQQPINNQQQGDVGDQKLQLPALPPPPPGGGGGGGAVGITGGSVRPAVSLAERARLAKIPQPEIALKCPRCESTNTKFCYFNNYSLSQPRHFCKTCRRYWTRGGALRNVPVGGGCRRNNKRSKGSGARSKSPVILAGSAGSSSSALLASSSCTSSDVIIGHMAPPPPPPQLPNILPPYNHLGTHYNSFNDIGLNFFGIQPSLVAKTGGDNGSVEFQIANNSSSGGVSGSVLSNSGLFEQWRLQQQVQQFPFLTSLDPSGIGLDPFGNGGGMEAPNYVGHQIRSSRPLDSGITTTLPAAATVKIEENHELNLSKKNLGVSGNDQYWGGGNYIAWTDNLPGFTSSSTSRLL